MCVNILVTDIYFARTKCSLYLCLDASAGKGTLMRTEAGSVKHQDVKNLWLHSGVDQEKEHQSLSRSVARQAQPTHWGAPAV